MAVTWKDAFGDWSWVKPQAFKDGLTTMGHFVWDNTKNLGNILTLNWGAVKHTPLHQYKPPTAPAAQIPPDAKNGLIVIGVLFLVLLLRRR